MITPKAVLLRRAEIGAWIFGFVLLGGAFAATARSRVYQARQGRAFSAVEESSAHGPAAPGSRPPAADLDPLVLGVLEIPRVGISAMVREGDDDATLAIAVGHVTGTARPGERGNMALAGHRDSFFRALRGIQWRDHIFFRSRGQRDEYRVDSIEVVAPEETDVLDPTPDARLTLVTCFPFEFVGAAPKRFVVRASRVER